MVVSFGTSYDQARERCIGAVEERIRREFPGCAVRRAFTSKMIIDKLAKRRIYVDTVGQGMEKLAGQGVDKLTVQPTHLIPGIEYEKLLRQIAPYRDAFQSVKIGAPLLYTEEDVAKMAEIMGRGIVRDADECLVLMGHGTDHQANDIYKKVDRAFQEKGYDGVFVGTVEARPDGQAVLQKARAYKKAVMAPLMLVAGDHAVNDMAGRGEDSWKSLFERSGIRVRTVMKGMGEYKGIQSMYVEHIRNAQP